MKSEDGKTLSSWYPGVEIPKFGPCRRSSKVDVCVVGAGIAGLTIAYLLSKAGKSVIVLDEGDIGGGQTGRTSAHLASAIDDRFIEIEKLHGKRGARLAYESHAKAIDTIEQIARELEIDCDFAHVDAYLTAVVADAPDLLDRELEAAKGAGFADVEKLESGGLNDKPCLRFGGQARFQPLDYLKGLAQAITKMGGKIYTGKRVTDVQGTDPKKKIPAYAQLSGSIRISADSVVVATNTPSPVNNWMGIYTKQASYRSYMIAAAIPRGAVADALYWDTADPYHYVRLQRSNGKNDLLLIGGEDHKTGQFPRDGAPFLNLEQWGRQMFPDMGKVRFKWSGQVQEPADGLAFIGRVPTGLKNVYVVTGDSGMGLTHGTIAGLLITDLIMGRPNPWEKLYDPGRKEMNRAFIAENANTLAQYKDFVTAGEVEELSDIRRGTVP
jgi:glycine/D-amino acid oxidase-like deaminating enzyme